MPTRLRSVLHALWQKGRMLLGIRTGDIARTGPIFVDLHLTGRCNLRCLCCAYHSPGSETGSAQTESLNISYDLVEGLYQELASMSTASVVLQGAGEPLLHPQILDIIALSKQNGFQTVLLTNGTLLDAEQIRSMIDSRLDVIKISLWATSPEEYDKNYPGISSQNLDVVLGTFKRAARLKQEQSSELPVIYWQFPINHYNWRSLDHLVEMAHAAGCDGVTLSPLHPVPNLDVAARLKPEETREIVPALMRIGKRMDRLGLRHNIPHVLMRYRMGEEVWRAQGCYIAWYHAHVRVDGTVQPCARSATLFGNLTQTRFKKIWNDTPIREFRRRTRTRAGLASIQSDCDCRYCYYSVNNARIDRVLAPLARFASAASG
jgi:MoaA/NifB/PqqE/SkfB family radical SAM enzyme